MLDEKNNVSQHANQALDKAKGVANKATSFAKKTSGTITNALRQAKGQGTGGMFKIKSLKGSTFSNIEFGKKGIVIFFAIAFIFAIVASVSFIGITSVVGVGNWFSSKDDLQKIRNKTSGIVQDAYDQKRNDIYPYIAEYINSNYGCSIAASEIENDVASKETSNKICNVKIEFEPDAMSAVDKINAYASSVNSTLSLLGGEGYEAETESETQELTTEDAEAYINMSDEEREQWLKDVKSDIDENGNEYQTQLNDNYAKTLKERKDQIFFVETNSDRWDINISYRKNVIVGYEERKICETYSSNAACLDTYRDECCLTYHYKEDKSKPIKKDVIEGTITVPMNYDVSFYKKEYVDELIPQMAEESGISAQEANEIVYQYIYNYYNSYFAIYGIENEGSATVMGIDPIFMEDGINGWEGHFTINDYRKTKYDYETKIKNGVSTDAIWSHIQSANGFEPDYTQCVGLSLGFIKDAYNEANIYGNGQNIVGNLVRDRGWLLLNTPAPGAVFSSGPYGIAGCDPEVSGCNPYGHTGVILAVQNGTVTYMEANYDRKGSIRIKTVNKNQMYSVFSSPYIKYAIPEYMKQ